MERGIATSRRDPTNPVLPGPPYPFGEICTKPTRNTHPTGSTSDGAEMVSPHPTGSTSDGERACGVAGGCDGRGNRAKTGPREDFRGGLARSQRDLTITSVGWPACPSRLYPTHEKASSHGSKSDGAEMVRSFCRGLGANDVAKRRSRPRAGDGSASPDRDLTIPGVRG